MHKTYENDDLVVFWDSDKCIHSKVCVTGCPEVFDINKRPWINIETADNIKVWQTIEKCPSGALGCLYRHGIDVAMDIDNCRSVAYDGDKQVGECDYQETDAGWNIYHTDVAPDYEGQGIAKRLVYKILEEAEKNKAKIIATCSYAKNHIGKC